ncbi:MAG: PrsW family intramembrane metalloprotease [Halodesulfurarchaeum sp.]
MRPDRTLRISLWETTRSVGNVDRRTGVAFLVVILLLAALVPAILSAQSTPGSGIYRVGVSEESPYYPVVRNDPSLRAVSPIPDANRRNGLELLITGTTVSVPDTKAGRAAARALREATIAYNDRIMRNEPNRSAAFPVTVSLQYRDQLPPAGIGPSVAGGERGTGGDSRIGGISRGTGGVRITRPEGNMRSGQGDGVEQGDGSERGDGSEGGGGDTGRQRNGESTATGEDTGGQSDRNSRGEIPGIPIGGMLGTAQTGTPSSIAPPFPLRSLLLAFVFLLPFNLVIQAYGSSVIAERINRRGEPLLVSPVSRGDIVVGKTLPYLLLAVGITSVITLLIGGGWLTVAALTPLAGLFLAATFFAAMIARSYKELTFLTVTISVGLTAYAFIPAVFADVHPIAAISPLTIVVKDLQSNPVGWGEFVFSTLPVALSTLVLFRLGAGIYREEDMFTQRPVPAKLLDALASPLSTRWSVGVWTALFIPFVLVGELAAVAVLYVLPGRLSIVLLLGSVALIEEIAKSVHVLAGFERGRFSRSPWTGALLGVVSGVGFFLVEKSLLITRLVGLSDLAVGKAAFGSAALGIAPGVLLFAPLLLHTATASIASVGASRSKRAYLLSVSIAVLLHLGYNQWVVSTLA